MKYFNIKDQELPHKPFPNLQETKKELQAVMHQYKNRKVPSNVQSDADKMEPLFNKYLEKNNLKYDKKKIRTLMADLQPLIVRLKNKYGRKRPNEYAKAFGINFKGDFLSSAQTPEYPSGHTMQAYVIALILSDEFPKHKSNLMKIADTISQSRIDRGVHFPSAIKYGKELAMIIHRRYKEPKSMKKTASFFSELSKIAKTKMPRKTLYHGSPFRLTTLKPRKPRGHTDYQKQEAVFMTDNKDAAALYALARDKKRKNKGWSTIKGRLQLDESRAKLNKSGYVYQVESTDYLTPPKGDESAGFAVRSKTKPMKRIKVYAKDYEHLIDRFKSKKDFRAHVKSLTKTASPRIPRKAGQPAGSDKHSDLYTDENPKGTIHGLKFVTPEAARKSVGKIKGSGKTHAHKTQAAIAMEQRARVAGKAQAANVYRAFIEEQKKITKEKRAFVMPKVKGFMRNLLGKNVAQTHIDLFKAETGLLKNKAQLITQENLKRKFRGELDVSKKRYKYYQDSMDRIAERMKRLKPKSKERQDAFMEFGEASKGSLKISDKIQDLNSQLDNLKVTIPNIKTKINKSQEDIFKLQNRLSKERHDMVGARISTAAGLGVTGLGIKKYREKSKEKRAGVVDEYARHAALNYGQAARDIRYFLDHPGSDKIAPRGSAKHKASSASLRLPSLISNLYYGTIPPHLHHTKKELSVDKGKTLKEMFLEGYAPWKYGKNYKKKRKDKEKKAMVSYGAPSGGRVEDDPNLPENQHQEDDTKHKERMDDIKEMLQRNKKKRILISKTLNKNKQDKETKIRQKKAQDYMEEDGKSDIYMKDKEKYSHAVGHRRRGVTMRIGSKNKLKKVCGGLVRMKRHKAKTQKYKNYSLKMF